MVDTVMTTQVSDEEPRWRKPAKQRTSWLLTVICLLLAAYFLLPLFWLVVASTKSNDDLFSTFGLWFADFNLVDNLKNLFSAQDGIYLRWMANSFIYAIISGVGAAFLATAAGYAFAKYKFPGSSAMFSIILGSIMVPTTALALPTYLLFARAGLTDTYASIIIPSLVSPFGVFLMRVYAADAVDSALIESGRVDGVGELRIFFSIAFRLLIPGTITVLLFSLVATWNNYFLPLIMLNSADKFPLDGGALALAADRGRRIGGPGHVLHRDHRCARLDPPDDRRLLVPAALLAVRSRHRRRQGLTPKGLL